MERNTVCCDKCNLTDGCRHFVAMVNAEEDAQFIQEKLDAAVLQLSKERERCAKIAEDLASRDTDWDTSYWNQACEIIAAKIRAVTEKPKSVCQQIRSDGLHCWIDLVDGSCPTHGRQ